MYFLIMSLVSFLFFLTAASATPSTIDIHVGQNNQLLFSPSTVTAPKGSTLNFHFYPANHSVSESLVRTPCRYTREGIWSGYVPVSSGVASTVFSVTLNDSDAHWLYSAQRDGHECQGGMVMVINPPDNEADTLDAYIKAARIASDSTDGFDVMGGLLVDDNDKGSSSSTGSGTVGSTSALTTAVTSATAVATSTGSGAGTGSGIATGITATATAAPTASATKTAASATAANATSTGAASALQYKSPAGIGAGVLLLSMWYYL